MFRHQGKSRTYVHNLRVAAILSFIAGIVNITGVLDVKVLTTNVTGHFAFFSEELMHKNYIIATLFLLYISCFLIGSFVSNIFKEITFRIKPQLTFFGPLILEIIILGILGLSEVKAPYFACFLLFTMGMQNALVTIISESRVRTTHLTGLFTDLGIELSQLFFYKQKEELQRLKKSISLRIVIILFFFLGCIIGGFLYSVFQTKTLLFASGFTLLALLYDSIRYRYFIFRRKIRSKYTF